MPSNRRPVKVAVQRQRSSGLRSAHARRDARVRRGDELEASAESANLEGIEREEAAGIAPAQSAQVLTSLRTHWRHADEADHENRQNALADDKFRNLEQWDPDIKRLRDAADEPCLVIDHLNTAIQQIGNQHRESRPAVKVSPKGSKASRKLATIIQDIVRGIEHDSMAPAAYAWGFDQALTSGRGYWRVDVEFASDTTNDLELKIRKILNKFSVYRDWSAVQPTREDARYYIITDDLPTSEYRQEYPHSRMTRAGANDLSGIGDDMKDWVSEDTVRVCEYWFKRKKKKRLIQTGPEDFTLLSEFNDEATQEGKTYTPNEGRPGLPITTHRDIDSEVVMWCKCNAVEILEGRKDDDGNVVDALEWKGKYIPIVELVGEELLVGDKLHYRGIIRRGRDPQTMLNTVISDTVLTQLRWPKHVWSGYVGQFGSSPNDPVFKQWTMVHKGRLPFVQSIIVKGPDGTALPAPVLNTSEPPIQGLVLSAQLAAGFIKDTTGYHDAAIGNLSPNERSGKAINALKMAAEQGSSHYAFNFGIALAFTGRIMVDLIPHVYNRPGRLVNVLSEDLKEHAILIGRPYRDGPDGDPIPIEQASEYRPGVDHFIEFKPEATYSVTVSPGRSHATVREETATALASVMEAAPQTAPVIAPVLVDNLDFPGSDALSEQLQAMLPPHMQKKKPGQPQIPPELLQQMDQAQKLIDMLTEEVKRLENEKASKLPQIESQERIAGLNNTVKMAIEQIKVLSAAASEGRAAGRATADAEFQAVQAAVAAFTAQSHERVMASEADTRAQAAAEADAKRQMETQAAQAQQAPPNEGAPA